MRSLHVAISALLASTALGCPAAQGRTDEQFSMGLGAPLAPFDSCMIYTAREPSSSASHVAACTPMGSVLRGTNPMGSVLRGTNPMAPPVGGTHYDQWANFERYTAPVPWGFLVHAMEHGAIVLAYRCEKLMHTTIRCRSFHMRPSIIKCSRMLSRPPS